MRLCLVTFITNLGGEFKHCISQRRFDNKQIIFPLKSKLNVYIIKIQHITRLRFIINVWIDMNT